jgi:hypothetical protein
MFMEAGSYRIGSRKLSIEKEIPEKVPANLVTEKSYPKRFPLTLFYVEGTRWLSAFKFDLEKYPKAFQTLHCGSVWSEVI